MGRASGELKVRKEGNMIEKCEIVSGITTIHFLIMGRRKYMVTTTQQTI